MRRLCPTFLFAGSLVIQFVISPPLQADEWTSLDGSRTVEAEMIGLWDDHVLLELSGGRRVSVPMRGLIAESRIQAEKLATQLADDRRRLSEELRDVADAEAAPAPDPLPTPPSTIGAATMESGMSARDAMQRIQDQIMGGRFAIMYKALPPSIREKTETFVDLFLRKSNASESRQSSRLTHRMADLIVTRQNWIASHPRLKAIGGEDEPAVELFRTLVVPACGAIRDGMTPDVMDPQSIADANFADWLNQREEVIAPYLAQIMNRYADDPPSWEVEVVKEGEATLKISPPGDAPPGRRAPPPVKLTNVDGYWIPQRVAEELVPMLDKAIEKLNGYGDGEMPSAEQSQLFSSANSSARPPGMSSINPQMMTAAFENFLGPLESATDAASFHQAADQIITMLEGFAAMAAPRR